MTAQSTFCFFSARTFFTLKTQAGYKHQVQDSCRWGGSSPPACTYGNDGRRPKTFLLSLIRALKGQISSVCCCWLNV